MAQPIDEGGEELPLPATAPLLGPDGSLIYTTSDGRQVIVCTDPDLARQPELLEAFQALRAGASELEQLGRSAESWILAAARHGVPRELAVRVLLGQLQRQLAAGEPLI